MPLNPDALLRAKFNHRKEAVAVPSLTGFFKLDEGETPVWEVRGLTGNELAKANDAEVKNRSMAVLAEALLANNKAKAQRVKEVQDALGMGDGVHGEIAKRIELLVLGSVNPVITHAHAARLAEMYPIEFYQLTNKITLLTGQGQVPEGK